MPRAILTTLVVAGVVAATPADRVPAAAARQDAPAVGTSGDSISIDELRRTLAALDMDRTSGREGERKAADYLEAKLREYEIPRTRYDVRAFLSWPIRAELSIARPDGVAFTALTPAFGGNTPPAGVTAALYWLPEGTERSRPLADEARDRIVVAHGLLSPESALRAQQAGAAGLLHVNETDVLHELIATTIWGTPTPASIARLPHIPIVSIGRTDGERLKAAAGSAPDVKVRMITQVRREWATIPLIVADLPGSSPEFVLVATHLDAWHRGMTDTAGTVASVLEMARVLNSQLRDLRRGVRFAWWPGHSFGRYAGSAWYADRFWADLDRYCVAYMNLDGAGRRGSRMDAIYAGGWPGLAEFSREFAQTLTGKLPPPPSPALFRPGRDSDSSFQGLGIPEFYIGVPGPGPGSPDVGPSGRITYWHTPEDTLDKIDLKALELDTRYRVAQIHRLATMPVLPHRIAPIAASYVRALEELSEKAKDAFDLGPVREAALRLASAAQRLDGAAPPTAPEAIDRHHALLIRLTHRLNATLYTRAGRFDQDPAAPLPILPLLADVDSLATLPRASDAFGFLETDLIRRRNAVQSTLLDAVEEIERYVGER